MMLIQNIYAKVPLQEYNDLADFKEIKNFFVLSRIFQDFKLNNSTSRVAINNTMQ